MSEIAIKFRKKEYNLTSDSIGGIVVFDTITKSIKVDGETYTSYVRSIDWDLETKICTITGIDGTTNVLNLVDATSGDAPNSILCDIRDDINNNKTLLSILTGTGNESIIGKINTKLNSLDTTVNIATESDNVVTLKSLVNETGGQINSNGALDIVLSKAAKTGQATDIMANYDNINESTGEVTLETKSLLLVLNDMQALILSLATKSFKYIIPTSNGTTPRGYRHYTSATASYNGNLTASSTTVGTIYLCKTSYTEKYHQIITVTTGNNYSWVDLSTADIDLSGYIKSIIINGKTYSINSGTTSTDIGTIINSITGDTDLGILANEDYVTVIPTSNIVNGVNTVNLKSLVKVVDINRSSDTVDGLVTAKNVKEYIQDNNTIFRTWTVSDLENI